MIGVLLGLRWLLVALVTLFAGNGVAYLGRVAEPRWPGWVTGRAPA
jgi:hypothetical protein